MFLFLSVLAVCVTFIWTVRYLVERDVRVTLPSVRVEVAAAPTVAPGIPGEPVEDPVPMAPRSILAICAQESEPFMQEKLLNDAYDFFRAIRNDHPTDEARWAVVETMMLQLVGDERSEPAEAVTNG